MLINYLDQMCLGLTKGTQGKSVTTLTPPLTQIKGRATMATLTNSPRVYFTL